MTTPPNYSHDIIDAKMDIDSKIVYNTADESVGSSTTDIESQDDRQAKLKAVQRKIDVKLLLWYSFVYLVLSIHKTNIANTAIINVEEGTDIITQLGDLSSGQWAWALRCRHPYPCESRFSMAPTNPTTYIAASSTTPTPPSSQPRPCS